MPASQQAGDHLFHDCRPASCERTRYEWLYVYGFVRPKTGELFAPTLSRVNVVRMTDALGAFARHADPDGRKVLVVLVDNAGWHRARSLVVPANVRLHFLPPYTPSCSRPSGCGR